MESVLLLRHTLATLAYRALRAFHPAPAGFSAFRGAPGSRSAGEILSHMGDLLDWAAGLLVGDSTWREMPPGEWDADQDRFFAALTRLDQALQQGGETVQDKVVMRLFQGPIADALTHVGQLSSLRRLAGAQSRPRTILSRTSPSGVPCRFSHPPREHFEDCADWRF